MFKNVVSTQDLLSDSQRSSYSSDSALFSLSERQQQSQSGFSQVRTQDLFTQNPSTSTGGSQSESSFPPARKISMYDKWMSKRPLFRKEDTMSGGSAGPLRPQQNTGNKSRDPEDRDLMQQVVNIVQDCNKEVKSTLTAVKEKLESHSEFSGEKLNDTMKAFLQDLWQHEQRMLQAIEDGQQSKDRLQEAEKQLAAKSAVIQQLQSQLEERDKPGDVKLVAKAVRQELLSPTLSVENKLMEILEVTREVSEQQSDHISQYQGQLRAQTKDYKEWKTANQKLLKDMEKRLQKDVDGLRKELQKTEADWSSTLQDQLMQACSDHTQDLEGVVERAVNDCTSALTRQGASNASATPTALAGAVKNELQSFLQKQSKATEKTLKTAWQAQAQKQQQQLQSLQHSLMHVLTEGLQSAAANQDRIRERDEQVVPLTVPAFEERIEEYHADLKQQLEDMHRHHMDEVKRLQVEAATAPPPPPLPPSLLSDLALASSALQSSCNNRPAFSDAVTVSATQSVMTATTSSAAESPSESQDFCPTSKTATSSSSSYRLQRRSGMARIPPISKVDRVHLFSKAKPSPVGSGIPPQQRQQQKQQQQHQQHHHQQQQQHHHQQQQQTSSGSHLVDVFTEASDTEVIFKDVSAEQTEEESDGGNATTGSKKRKTTRGGKKMAGKKVKVRRAEPRQKSCPKVPVEKVMTATTTTAAATKSSVYDFSDDPCPERGCRQPFKGFPFRLQRSLANQRKALCSPTASTDSCLSSPAMSITVDTEMVWVRRSRWQTCRPASADTEDFPTDGVRDILSSPFMNSTITYHTPLPQPQPQVEENHTKFRWTRSCAKRLL